MPERLQTFVLTPVGGLDLRQDVKMHDPGSAIILQNMEPAIKGGYRRISGTSKLDSEAVPGINKILGVVVFGGGVIAAREHTGGVNADIYRSTGAGWVKINSDTRAKTSGRYRFWRYNWNGTEHIVGVDGTNQAFTWDGSTYTLLNDASAPTNAKYVTEFKNHLFFAGYSSNRSAIKFTEPNNANDYDPADGAGEFVIGDEITGLYAFRDQLIIFCRNSLYRLQGSSLDDFEVHPIAKRIGCVAPDSIQEVNGDILFLAPDGVRTVAATERIGDFELGSLSNPVRARITSLIPSADNICSCVVREKNQYRIFFPVSGIAESASVGVLGAFRVFGHESAGHEQAQAFGKAETIEWAEIVGVKPSCADSYNVGTSELVVHGGYDGFVYRQESGNSFNGANINAIYQTPHLDLGDGSIRKIIHRINTYIRREGTSTIKLLLIYNHGAEGVVQPPPYNLTSSGVVHVYGTAIYGTATYGARPEPNARNLVEGSGFHVSLKFESSDTAAAWAVEGALIEFATGGRR